MLILKQSDYKLCYIFNWISKQKQWSFMCYLSLLLSYTFVTYIVFANHSVCFVPLGWEWEKKSPFWKCSAVWQISTKTIHWIIPDFKVTTSISSVVIIFLFYFILRWENIYLMNIFKIQWLDGSNYSEILSVL